MDQTNQGGGVLTPEKEDTDAFEAKGTQMENVSEPPKPLKKKKDPKIAKKRKKRIKMIVAIVLVALVVGAIVFGIVKLFQKKEDREVLTDFSYRGSLTTMISGSGGTVPLVSETIKSEFSSTINNFFVSIGDNVSEGDALFALDTSALTKDWDEAGRELSNMRTQYAQLLREPKNIQDKISATREKIADCYMKAPFSGKLLDVQVKKGDTLAEGSVVATLVDDSCLRLRQYFSYAYENDVKIGQAASVSISASMATVAGKVEAINKVEKLSAEGTKLFEVVFLIDNPGTLTEGMAASATMTAGTESITPYQAETLEYARVEDLVCKAGGKVTDLNMLNHLKVSEGKALLTIENDAYASDLANYDVEVVTAQQNIEEMAEKMATQEEVVEKIEIRLGDNVVYSPVTGMVTSIAVDLGRAIEKDVAIITVSDLSVILVDAKIDAINVGSVQQGTSVEIIQYGREGEEYFTGVVESISLEGQQEENFAYFPAKIRVENPSGAILAGNWVNFNIVASEVLDCIVVPIQAVRYTDAGAVVFLRGGAPDDVVDLGPAADIPEGFYPVVVEIGISDNYGAEVIHGLDEGVEVFTQYMTSDSQMMYY